MVGSAKYSGLDFKIPPMASDPKELAAAMVQVAKHPTKSKFTSWSSFIIKSLYSLFPKTIVNVNSAALRLMMSNDESTDTNGNVLQSSPPPLRIYGETMLPVPSKTTKAVVLSGLGILGAIWFFSSKRK